MKHSSLVVLSFVFFFLTSAHQIPAQGDPYNPLATIGVSAPAGLKFVYWSGGKIKEIIADLNHDGRPDFYVHLSKKGAVLSIEADNNFDGKIDEKTIYKNDSAPLVIQTTDLDTNYDGKMDTRITESLIAPFIVECKTSLLSPSKKEPCVTVPLSQALSQGLCPRCQAESGAVRSLVQMKELARLFNEKPKADFHYPWEASYKTNYGIEIASSCTTQFGKSNMVNNVAASFKTGLTCMAQLNTPATNKYIASVAALLRDPNHPHLKIKCDAEKAMLIGRDVAAVAMPILKGEDAEIHLSQNLKINDEIKPPKKMPANQISSHFLQGLIFHETFHNMGDLHGLTKDHAYTCETCCFHASGENEETQKLGCKLCQDQYKNPKDHEYLQDILHFNRLTVHEHFSIAELYYYIVEHPNDRWAQFKLADETLGTSDQPFAVAMAEALKTKYPQLSIQEKQLIEAAETTQQDKSFKEFEPYLEINRKLADMIIKYTEDDVNGMYKDALQLKLPPETAVDPTLRGLLENHATSTAGMLVSNLRAIYIGMADVTEKKDSKKAVFFRSRADSLLSLMILKK